MKLYFPVLLAIVWIALVGMTLTDFAGFASATRTCVPAAVSPGQKPVALALNARPGRGPARVACP